MAKPKNISALQISPKDIKNIDTVSPVYCNNFQFQGGPIDVWLGFNLAIPNGDQLSVERKATVVMSGPEFMIMVGALNQAAQNFVEQAKQQQHQEQLPAVVVSPQRRK